MGQAMIGLFLGLDGSSTGGIAATATAVEFKLHAIHQERTEIRVDRGNCTGRDTTSFPFPLERDHRQRKESSSRLLVYHWYCHAVFVFLDRRNRTRRVQQMLIIKQCQPKIASTSLNKLCGNFWCLFSGQCLLHTRRCPGYSVYGQTNMRYKREVVLLKK